MTTSTTPDMLRAAQAYAKVWGWRVFPVCYPDDNGNCGCGGSWDKDQGRYVPHTGRDIGKRPIGSLAPNGFQSASSDEQQIEKWWTVHPHANIGWAIPRGVFVLDCDPRNGGDDTADDLEAEHGPLPDTIENLTGGGGWHRPYSYDPDAVELTQTDIPFGPGIDLKVGGKGYVILPPSLHPSGRRYTWEASSRPGEVEIAPAPDWLLKLVAASATAPKAAEGNRGVPLPISARTWEFIAKGAPKGQQRARALAAARNLLAYGKTVEETADLLATAFERCEEVDPNNLWTYADALKIAQDIASRPAPKLTPRKPWANPPPHPPGGSTTNSNGKHDADAAPPPPPGNKPPSQPETPAVPEPGTGTTELSNAERFIQQHGENARFVPAWKAWVIWDGTRWQRDDLRQVRELAIKTVRAIYTEAAAADEEAKRAALAAGGALHGPQRDAAASLRARADALTKWAKQSESDAKISAMLSLAEALPGVAVRPDAFDADPWLLNCQNGTVNLRTGDLLPHQRGHMITKVCRAAYRPDAPAPVWDAFLRRAMGGNDDKLAYLRRTFGYALTGHTGEECLFFLYGSGRNGKSKALGAFEHMMGDYARSTRPETFMDQGKSSAAAATPDLADLAGVRFAPTIETAEGSRIAESLLKSVTGGDTIKARHLFSHLFSFTPQFKLFLASNHKPRITGTDEAIWSRIRTIPFTVTIPEGERDAHLADKLKAEADGILRWSVEGCLEWQINGLGEPDEVRQATANYRAEMDILGAFLADCCVMNERTRVTAKALRAAYEQWCDQAGEKPISTTAFGRRLGERGLGKGRDERGIWYSGIGLLAELQP